MEYCDKGDLFQKITMHKKNETLFEEKEIWNTLIQILLGLKELHNRKIFHRDLKSANIFLSKSGAVKIGDLNVSKIAKKGLLYTQTGTPYYASPEVWKDKPYDHKSDIWSLGCIIYEMATLKPPFRADNMEGLYKKVIKGAYDKLPQIYSKELNEVLRLMLQVKPGQRADCETLLSLPYINEKLDERYKLISEEVEYQSILLNTIRVPENPVKLSECMPKANYQPLRVRRADRLIKNCSLEVYDNNNSKPHNNIFMSLNLVSGSFTKDHPTGTELSNSQKRSKVSLPVLQHKNLSYKKLLGQENINNHNENSMQAKHLKQIEQKLRVELLLNKKTTNGQVEFMRINGLSQQKSPYQPAKIRINKNMKLDPIKQQAP